MFILNNKTLQLDTAFTTEDGTQYPPNWLRLASAEERAAIGIVEASDPEPYDDRFYWSAGHAKDIDQCKVMLVAQVKQSAGSLLAPTDWKVIRFIESNAIIGAVVTEYREAVRAASNANETAIAACTTVEELAALQLTFPTNE